MLFFDLPFDPIGKQAMTTLKPQNKKLRSVARMKEIMTEYYIGAKTARDTGKKVAWITSGGPVEPLLAMDVIPVYPENHGAMIGAAKMGADLCETAESMGYPSDLCSYARADIGCAVTNGGPIGGLPAPDMLVCCNNICGTVLKWYEIQARRFDVPLFVLDTPVCHTGFSAEARAYVRTQVENYIVFLETTLNRPFDRERMQQVGKRSIEAQRLWQQVLLTLRHHPAPMSAFDAFFHLALIVTLRGTPVVIDYYRMLLAELEERITQGIGAVENERYRLLWDNLPVWYRTKWLSEKFASWNACLVADTYTSAWCSSLPYMNENDFLGSMAEGYTRIYLNLGIDAMADILMEMIDTYDIHGVVMHSNRSCKPYSFGQYDMAEWIRQRRGIPVLLLDADMVDPRQFSEAQIEARIDAFMEMMQG
jgi:benzoyl-CoA reductase/2-hydroxyglutaryl-CoA dehydratase subunit BcrC/BadD/HgdB